MQSTNSDLMLKSPASMKQYTVIISKDKPDIYLFIDSLLWEKSTIKILSLSSHPAAFFCFATCLLYTCIHEHRITAMQLNIEYSHGPKRTFPCKLHWDTVARNTVLLIGANWIKQSWVSLLISVSPPAGWSGHLLSMFDFKLFTN